MLFIIITMFCLIVSIILRVRLANIGIIYVASFSLFVATMILPVTLGALSINVVLLMMLIVSFAVLELCDGLNNMLYLLTIVLNSKVKYINCLASAVRCILTVLARLRMFYLVIFCDYRILKHFNCFSTGNYARVKFTNNNSILYAITSTFVLSIYSTVIVVTRMGNTETTKLGKLYV